MRFGSVCSGIEAASAAWYSIGWRAAWFSEIEFFPSVVLAHHYPDVPNLGDMTTLPARIRLGEVEAPDLFCGGTPCQAFSVAGLRRSLDDARGNLSLVFCEIADAIDSVRRSAGLAASIVFWENVPGVLNTKDNAFGCFLAGLAGEDDPLVPPGGKWTDAGVVHGPQRTVAWRILDAQYFGLAQRRRRVFVVASARDGFDPAAVLFEYDGVRRDSPPSREAGQSLAPTVTNGHPFSRTGNERVEGDALVSMCLNAGGQSRLDAESETLIPTIGGGFDVAHSLRGEGFDASEDGTGRGTPLVPVTMRESGQGYWMQDDIAGTLRAEGEDRPSRPSHVIGTPVVHPVGITLHGTDGTASVASLTDLSSSLRARIPSGVENSTTTAVMQPVAFADTAPTLSVGAHGSAGHPHRQHGNETAVIGMQPMAFDTYNQTVTGDTAQTLCSRGDTPGGNAHLVPAIQTAMQVRRLTPTECERLQGFPDGYTNIPWRGKPASECPDGPRYKALGNSWAVPVVQWIGKRIAKQC